MRRAFVAPVLALLGAGTAFAQAPGPQEAPPPNNELPATPAPATPAPAAAPTVYQPFGFPAPGPDPNQALPSSSRPMVGDTSDGFDLAPPSSGSTTVLRGNNGATAVLGTERPMTVPDIHVVRDKDTLWDLSASYFQNPWQWPKIWKSNPHIKNPHWIYPGDQLRFRASNEIGGGGNGSGMRALTLGGGRGGAGRAGLLDRREAVPRNTVFLRDQGFIGDAKKDVWGELVGAVEEQMLLADGNQVYLILRPGVTPEPGQELTVFRTVRQPEDVPGARKPPGEIVAVNGTVRVDAWDPKTRIARAQIVESVDVIERGAKVGPVRRQFDVVPPKENTRDVEARVLTSFYPHVYHAQNQVVFLDRGSEDGLVPGNTLVVLRKGDTWRKSLATASPMLRDRMRMDSPDVVDVETTPLKGDPQKFPEEGVAELRILRSEKYSSVALVTQSRRELVAGDRAVSRAGR